MAQTGLLLTPTLDECRRAAIAERMPEREGDKFFHHYTSNGWKVGKLPMKSFASAMSGWRLRWEEKGRPGAPNGSCPAPLGGATVIVMHKEYERILERLRVIRNSYDSHNDLRPGDRLEVAKLKKRRDELRKLLSITI